MILMAKKIVQQEIADKTNRFFIGAVIDYGIVDGRDPQDVANMLKQVKEEYSLSKVSFLYDPQLDFPEDVKEMARIVSGTIGTQTTIHPCPENTKIFTQQEIVNIAKNTGARGKGDRNKILVNLNPDDRKTEGYKKQFLASGFDVCISSDLEEAKQNIVTHIVDGVKNWSKPSLG
jgi:hypothetical protein